MKQKPTYGELLKKVEYYEKREDQQLKLKTYLNAFEDGVYLCSATKDIEYLNSAMIAKIGRNAIGEKCYKAIYNLEEPCTYCYYDKLKEQGKTSIELKLGTKDYLVSSILLENDSKISVYTDITKLKKNEEDLKKQNLELLEREKELKKLSTAVEQSASSIVITDINGTIEYTNPKFTETSGYTAEEVLGKNPRILKSGKQSKEFYTNLWNTILSGEIWRGELNNKTKSGDTIWEQVSITPIKNKEGIIINFLADKENVTTVKESEKVLKSFINSVTDIICYKDGEGRWLLANDAILELFGLTNVDYYGKTDAELAHFTNDIYKKPFSSCMVSDEVTWENKKATHGIEIIPTIHGTEKIYDIVKIPTFYNNGKRKALAIIGRDITELKETEKELNLISSELSVKNKMLLESKNRFSNLFEESPVAIWEEDYAAIKSFIDSKQIPINNLKKYLDKNTDFVKECLSKLRILNINKTALEILEVANKEKFIEHLGKNLNGEKLETFKETLLTIVKGKSEFIKETKFIKNDGENIYVILKLVTDANFKSIISIINVTPLKTAEKKLKEQNKKLKKAKEKAEESDQLKTEFLNNMSHEIRTPLNGILGFSELISEETLSNEKRVNYGTIIKSSGNQLLQVIDDILEISRLGTKQVKTIEKEVNLNTLLLHLFSIFDIKAKENKIPLYLKKGLLDTESCILTDELKLNKILSNLLENALKFTEKGNIEFGYILNNSKPAQLEIYVKDTGIGIHKANQKSIFKRFSQEEKELSQKSGGLGLGLSIAKENSELLGGTITLESKKGEGATFTVIIPYKPTKSNNTILTTISSKKISNTKKTILIAEDEEVNYIFLETLLHDSIKLDCTLIHAKNGKEAVEICKENSAIDLVLMDIKMPYINGYEATKLIKEFRPNLPIIAQTAYSTMDDIKKSKAIGCDDFISKPISKKTLNTILNTYLKIEK